MTQIVRDKRSVLSFGSHGIFLVQFILSWFGGDTDLDGELDMNVSDIVSFKGLIHFIMGASGWLCVKQSVSHSVEWYDRISMRYSFRGYTLLLI